MPGTFQLWNGMFLLSDSGLLAIHPDCCCTTAGTTRCCGGSDLSTRVRITAQGFSNDSCDDCSDLDGVYDTDFLSSRTEYDSDFYGDWPTYEWYWLGGTFASPCWEDDLVWLACLQEIHYYRPYSPYTCEGGVCHNDKPWCRIHSWLTTPEQADTIAGGGYKGVHGYSPPFFHWESLGAEDEIPFCQGSQQRPPMMGYRTGVCYAPYDPDGIWMEQL